MFGSYLTYFQCRFRSTMNRRQRLRVFGLGALAATSLGSSCAADVYDDAAEQTKQVKIRWDGAHNDAAREEICRKWPRIARQITPLVVEWRFGPQCATRFPNNLLCHDPAHVLDPKRFQKKIAFRMENALNLGRKSEWVVIAEHWSRLDGRGTIKASLGSANVTLEFEGIPLEKDITLWPRASIPGRDPIQCIP